MTQDEILATPQLFTDAEILAFYKDKLAITRPTEELRQRNAKKGSKKMDGQLELLTGEQLEERRIAKELAAQMGIDLSDILPT
jgi:predicted ATPase